MSTMTTSEVVKVKREKLAACMTCPICNKLFSFATTISECLHTFCRKCIYDKITIEEVDKCPVCNISLGCAPLEKLRADNSLQDVRDKIFPLEGTEDKADEVVPSIPLPARRKEINLSSLVVNTPRQSAKTVLTVRRRLHRTKAKDLPESSGSPETFSKIAQDKRKNLLNAESSKQPTSDKRKGDIPAPLEQIANSGNPLNSLAETASKTNSCKSNSQFAKTTPSHDNDNEASVPEIRVMEHDNEAGDVPKVVKECDHTSNVNDDENGSTPLPSGSVRPRKLQCVRRRKASASEESNMPAQPMIDASSTCGRVFSPIWFSLVASNNQEGNEPLPQIPSCYLRIKDGNVPVSFVKKYIVKKLDIASEAEVEIRLNGQPVVSTLRMHDLVDLWLQTAPNTSERIQVTAGSSAKDLVMVLSYGRKAQPCY